MIRKIFDRFNTAAESFRGVAEWGSLYTFWHSIKSQTPAADGRAVMILPGILSGDMYTAPLRDMLQDKGYKVYGWDGGTNMGFNEKTAAHLVDRLHDVFAKNGGRKITLVGHSLGGIFARELAREFPEMVESVITLGSPFGMTGEAVPDFLMKIYEFINPGFDPTEFTDADLQQRRLTPPPVPTTSIYSTSDGVVPWKACINPATPHTENICVDSSHTGMIYHPLAVTAVLDRLAQDNTQWKPFDAAKYSRLYAAGPAANDIPQNPAWKKSDASRTIFKKK